jgi:uncharacterized SAM-binding protein YcdF (DUF218 family)
MRAQLVDIDADTRAEAYAVTGSLGKRPFILVTSAYHLPRTVRQTKAVGAQSIPPPTGQLTGSEDAHR